MAGIYGFHPVIAEAWTELEAIRKQPHLCNDPLVDLVYRAPLIHRVRDLIFEECRAVGLRFISLDGRYLMGFEEVTVGAHGHLAVFHVASKLGICAGSAAAQPLHYLHFMKSVAGIYDLRNGERLGKALNYDLLRVSGLHRPVPEGQSPNVAACQMDYDRRPDYLELYRTSPERTYLIDWEQGEVGPEFFPRDPITLTWREVKDLTDEWHGVMYERSFDPDFGDDYQRRQREWEQERLAP